MPMRINKKTWDKFEAWPTETHSTTEWHQTHRNLQLSPESFYHSKSLFCGISTGSVCSLPKQHVCNNSVYTHRQCRPTGTELPREQMLLGSWHPHHPRFWSMVSLATLVLVGWLVVGVCLGFLFACSILFWVVFSFGGGDGGFCCFNGGLLVGVYLFCSAF